MKWTLSKKEKNQRSWEKKVRPKKIIPESAVIADANTRVKAQGRMASAGKEERREPRI